MLNHQNSDKTSYHVILDLAALVQRQPAEKQDKDIERMVGLDF